MKRKQELAEIAVKLRQQAEIKLLGKENSLPGDVDISSPENIRAALHELRVHQIELEMQNDELRQTQLDLEKSQSRYFDLYDLAPVGYVTLSDKGMILQANLTCASLLGIIRSELTRNLLSHFIIKEDQDIFYRMRSELIKTNQQQKCELRLRKNDGSLFWAQLEAVIAEDESGENAENPGAGDNSAPANSVLRIIIVDITAGKQKQQELNEARWRLQSIIEGTHLGTWEWNVQTGEMVINELWAAMVGYTLNELAPVNIDTWHNLIHPDDLLTSDEIVKKHFASRLDDVDSQYRMLHKDGHWIWIQDRGRLITRTADGQPWMMFGTHTDISKRIKMEEALKESNERFSKMFTRHHSVMLLIDPKSGIILDANKAAENFYGYSRPELKAMSIYELNTMPREFVAKEMNEALDEKKNLFIFSHRLSNGKELIVEVHSTPIMIGEQELLFSIIHDITDRRKAEEKLISLNLELKASLQREQMLARTDVLTGINNRRRLFEIAEQQFESAARYRQPLSIIMFDIDHFKNINDIYGHSAGDQMLKLVTQIAAEELRSSDEIGRIGGEEFVIILPMTTAENACLLAERIRTKVESLRLHTETGDAAVTLSIGISENDLESMNETADSLIHLADKYMYIAKNAGRNQIKIADR